MLRPRFRMLTVFASCLFGLTVCACMREPPNSDEQIVLEVRQVMEAQQAAWNRGDVEGFMEGYDRADTTTFVSGDQLISGWETVLERYKKQYSSREQMGTLTFAEVAIKPIGRDLCLADGRWSLARSNDAPHGRFTLVF